MKKDALVRSFRPRHFFLPILLLFVGSNVRSTTRAPKRTPDPNGCVAEFESQISSDYNNAAAWFGAGACEFTRHDYNAAVDDYVQAIRIKPDYVDAHLNAGIAYEHLERWDMAEKAFENVILYQPHSVIGHERLGLARIHKEDYRGAVKALREGYKGGGQNNEQINFLLGTAYLGLRDRDRALESLRALREIHSSLANTLANLISAASSPEISDNK